MDSRNIHIYGVPVAYDAGRERFQLESVVVLGEQKLAPKVHVNVPDGYRGETVGDIVEGAGQFYEQSSSHMASFREWFQKKSNLEITNHFLVRLVAAGVCLADLGIGFPIFTAGYTLVELAELSIAKISFAEHRKEREFVHERLDDIKGRGIIQLDPANILLTSFCEAYTNEGPAGVLDTNMAEALRYVVNEPKIRLASRFEGMYKVLLKQYKRMELGDNDDLVTNESIMHVDATFTDGQTGADIPIVFDRFATRSDMVRAFRERGW